MGVGLSFMVQPVIDKGPDFLFAWQPKPVCADLDQLMIQFFSEIDRVVEHFVIGSLNAALISNGLEGGHHIFFPHGNAVKKRQLVSSVQRVGHLYRRTVNQNKYRYFKERTPYIEQQVQAGIFEYPRTASIQLKNDFTRLICKNLFICFGQRTDIPGWGNIPGPFQSR